MQRSNVFVFLLVILKRDAKVIEDPLGRRCRIVVSHSSPCDHMGQVLLSLHHSAAMGPGDSAIRRCRKRYERRVSREVSQEELGTLHRVCIARRAHLYRLGDGERRTEIGISIHVGKGAHAVHANGRSNTRVLYHDVPDIRLDIKARLMPKHGAYEVIARDRVAYAPIAVIDFDRFVGIGKDAHDVKDAYRLRGLAPQQSVVGALDVIHDTAVPLAREGLVGSVRPRILLCLLGLGIVLVKRRHDGVGIHMVIYVYQYLRMRSEVRECTHKRTLLLPKLLRCPVDIFLKLLLAHLAPMVEGLLKLTIRLERALLARRTKRIRAVVAYLHLEADLVGLEVEVVLPVANHVSDDRRLLLDAHRRVLDDGEQGIAFAHALPELARVVGVLLAVCGPLIALASN